MLDNFEGTPGKLHYLIKGGMSDEENKNYF